MTPDELRALDAKVAERIFDRDPLNARVGLHENGDLEYSWGYPVGHDIAPHYSTDIGAAWRIVEHLRQRGWTMNLNVNHYTTEPWDCRFFFDPRGLFTGTEKRAIGHGPTAAIAICRAALATQENT